MARNEKDWDSLTKITGEDKSYMLGQAPKPASLQLTEAEIQSALQARTEQDLSEFLGQVLPNLNEAQFFRLICAIPAEHMPQPENYDGEEEGNVSLEGLLQRMQRAVKAMYNQVFLNGQVRSGIDIGEVQKAMNACRDAFKAVLSFEKEIYTLNRQKAVESATLTVLRDKFPDLAEPFLAALEEELSKEK